MTEIQTLLLEAVKTMQAEQVSMKKQISTLEIRLTELEQMLNALAKTQEELGKTQEELLKAQEEASSIFKGLETDLTKQFADVEDFLQELEGLVSGLRKEE